MEGVSAILLESSGVIYSNQTGGCACTRPEAEGILVPFNNDPPLDSPEKALWRRLRSILENAPYLTPELADRVDAVLADDPDTHFAKVDRSRLRDSHESWVYVEIAADASFLLRGFGPAKAILTWPNSD